MVIFLIGYMGSGKTTVGKPLARELGYRFVDMDHYITDKHGMTVSEIFERHGEEGFREIEKTALREIASGRDLVIATGGGAPCFHGNMDYMNSLGTTIYLKVSPQGLVKRLEYGKEKRPLLQDKTPEQLLEFIRTALEGREVHYGQAGITVDCDGYSDRQVVEKCRNAILSMP